MKRILTVVGLLAATIALTATSASGHPTMSISCRRPDTANGSLSYTKAVLDCTSSSAARLRWNVGPGLMIYGNSGTHHAYRVEGLEPSNHYPYTASLLVADKWKVFFSSSFDTPKPGPAVAKVRNGNVTLDGSPFFPVITRVDCPHHPLVDYTSMVKANVLLGIGASCGGEASKSPSEVLEESCQNRCWWLEMDQPQSQVAFPQLMNLATDFDLNSSPNPDVIHHADGHLLSCNKQDSSATDLYGEVRSMTARGKPVVDWVWLAKKFADRTTCLDQAPQKLNVLLAIPQCAGSKGVMYTAFGPYPLPANLDAVKRVVRERAAFLARRMAIWAPLQFSPKFTVRKSSPRLVACGHRYGGVNYVRVINATDKPVTGSISGVGHSGQTVWRYRETGIVSASRLKVQNGAIKDHWAPYDTIEYAVT